jgi:hypothetical protein
MSTAAAVERGAERIMNEPPTMPTTELKVLRLQPGEVLIIQAARPLSREERARIEWQCEQCGVKAAVFDDNLKVVGVSRAVPA